LPFLIQAEIAKDISSRYLIFSATPLFFLVARFCDKIFDFGQKRFGKFFAPLFLILISIFPAIFIFLLIANPQKAPLPHKERSGYLEEWTSGYGIKESADYLKRIAQKEKVVIGTEGAFGTLPDGLQIYLEGEKNITVLGIGVPVSGPTQALLNSLSDSRVFLLANDTRVTFKTLPNLKEVKRFKKAKKQNGLQESLILFEVKKI